MLIKGLIFDMDGLLVDTEGLHVIAWKELFREQGIKLDSWVYPDYAGVADNLFLDSLKDKGLIPTSWETGSIIAVKTKKLISIAEKEGVLLFPGVKEILEFACTRFKIAVASNSERDIVSAVLKNAGLAGYFRFAISRNDVGNPKPEPDIYLETAKKMGLKPCECLVFEDSEVGVESAKKAGMMCVAITTTCGQDKLKKADHVYARLSPGILKDILKW